MNYKYIITYRYTIKSDNSYATIAGFNILDAIHNFYKEKGCYDIINIIKGEKI